MHGLTQWVGTVRLGRSKHRLLDLMVILPMPRAQD